LLFRFLFDPEITLYSRMTRESASGQPRRAQAQAQAQAQPQAQVQAQAQPLAEPGTAA
jgi:hypothetical protein